MPEVGWSVPSLDLASLAAFYTAEPSGPLRVLAAIDARITAADPAIFIHRASLESMKAELAEATRRRLAGESLPLFGVPYVVKDNIDVAGIPTTAACPAFAYVPQESAAVVERLHLAGAIFVGKANLDQFATGLVGTRSPYGACKNPFDPRYVSGGSSSGSAVSVALGLASFALGTDTAGSGRVPAAFCDLVGLKPTKGALSTRGVVPACRTLDCVSIFAKNCADAKTIFELTAHYDERDPFSRDASREDAPIFFRPLRFGIPKPEQLQFFGDADAERLYMSAIARLESMGATRVEFDYAPFEEAAQLLYSGPWVAERLHAAGPLLARDPSALHPVIRSILESAYQQTALDAFRGQYRLAELRRDASAEWEKMDVLLLPTTPTIYTAAQVESEPIELNQRLGYYTNFVNLMDLAAVAVPAGFRADGLPLGVTFMGRAHSDHALLALASRFRATSDAPPRSAHGSVPEPAGTVSAPVREVMLAVAGAHLTGQPLNHQLASRRARLVRACRTSPHYRLYALAGTEPPKPGLVYDPSFNGDGIEIEVWALDRAGFGSFVDEVPPPLAIGTILLEDGSAVNGFVCEPHAVGRATDITSYGGWRRYREAISRNKSH
jgi:allophanate hydrolase